MSKLPSSTEINIKRLRGLVLSTAILVFLLIVWGGVMRVTDSANACPDWPTCFGQLTPPAETSALVNYLHRALALAAAVMVTVSAAAAWLANRRITWLTASLALAAGIMLAQIAIGGYLALGLADLNPSLVAGLHSVLALSVQALVLLACVAAFEPRVVAGVRQMRFRTPFARLALASLASLALLLATGLIVANSGAAPGALSACTAWPLCLPDSPAARIQLFHRLVVLMTGGLLFALLLKAWRTRRTNPLILTTTTAAFVLFFAQALLGSQLVGSTPMYLLALHQATAVAAWGALVVLAAGTGFSLPVAVDEQAEALTAFPRRRARDFLMLTKPIVVALLLVTTFAGMVIGAQAWPSISLVFWTLLGGFMAAGGSGAINQYIDRYDDQKMQRTQKRPIPSGRLTPAEGLAFGVALALASFYLMTAFVNFLAALLTLAGIIYYVLIYSILLKKTTTQNIVIGGGAGAIPPLVGWAAATGSLNIPSLFLFAVIFMWTPPHFWALALVRRKDYARARVPMLPVIRGEKVTRWQIFLYTLELVALTLLLPVFGLGGSIYLVGAAVLGLWLISTAWIVWKKGGNKSAWKMYRYSSMYLAFIFLVLMIDRLV